MAASFTDPVVVVVVVVVVVTSMSSVVDPVILNEVRLSATVVAAEDTPSEIKTCKMMHAA